MSNNERELQMNLEDCFYELKHQYQEVLDENKKLQDYIKLITDLCKKHYVEFPPFEEPAVF